MQNWQDSRFDCQLSENNATNGFVVECGGLVMLLLHALTLALSETFVWPAGMGHSYLGCCTIRHRQGIWTTRSSHIFAHTIFQLVWEPLRCEHLFFSSYTTFVATWRISFREWGFLQFWSDSWLASAGFEPQFWVYGSLLELFKTNRQAIRYSSQWLVSVLWCDEWNTVSSSDALLHPP